MKMFGDISIQVSGSERILDDVISYVGKVATVNHDLGDLESDELQQVIEVLNTVARGSRRRLMLWGST
jgi:hypothetical protein